MSDSCMYELEDIVWEEFGDNEDHIVPHAGGKTNGCGIESDRSKRPRYELTSTEKNADSKNASNNVIQRKQETRFCSVKEEKEIMLEKSPWPHSSGGAVSASLGGEPNRKALHSTCDEAMTSDQCVKTTNMDSTANELYADDPILGDRTATVDNNLYRNQLNNASRTENDLGFFGNNLPDKERNDLLYYGWPELENFEDVDRMFRSCDSTFGLEIDNDGDELGWFLSSQATEGSDDGFKSSLNFSASDPRAINNVTEHQDVSERNNAGLVVDEIVKQSTSVDWKRGLEKLTSNGSAIVMESSYSNGSGAVPNIGSDSQVHSYVSQSENQKPSEVKRKEHFLDTGDSFIHFGDLKQESNTGQSLDFQCSIWAETKQQDIAPPACLQMPLPLLKSNTVPPPNQFLAGPRSLTIKSEDSGLTSLSPRESSYASNQMQSTESSHDVSFQHPTVIENKKKEKSNQCRLSCHPEKSNLMVQRAHSDPISAQRQVPNFENEVEGQSEANGSDICMLGELDSSNIHKSSSMSSVLDEISNEASSFRQLQHVLEQLDIRTKLCIRDSLYRLARSADQRHKCVNPTSISRDAKDPSGALISDETNNDFDRSAGYIDMETDTNPIDRSIAHLLFHRPSDPSATGSLDAVPMKSHTMVRAPDNGPVMAKKFVCQEETTSANVEPLNNECDNCEN